MKIIIMSQYGGVPSIAANEQGFVSVTELELPNFKIYSNEQ